MLLLASEGTGGALGILLLQVPLPEVNWITDTSNIFQLSDTLEYFGNLWNTLECWKVRWLARHCRYSKRSLWLHCFLCLDQSLLDSMKCLYPIESVCLFALCFFSKFLHVFLQQQNFAMGSLAQISSGAIRCSFKSGGFWCRYLVRFRRVPLQIPCEVPEGSGADTWLGSRGFWCRYLVRFRKFPVQLPDDSEGLGPGEDAWWGSGGFRGRYLVRFRKVPVQRPCEVPEGFGGENAWWGSEGFRCRYLVRFRRALVQMLCEIPKGSDVFYGIST